jgi:lysophospholipase L1-like esterase
MWATSRCEPGVVRRYVAMGDSFTAGVEGAEGTGRWPDALADRLRAANPSLDYRNLAVAGARSDAVARDQLDPAVALGPDLVTLVCGANDVLLSVRPEIERYAATFSAMLRRLRTELPGAAIVTATTPDFGGFLGLHERSRRRVGAGIARLGDATRSVARRHGVPCLEFAGHPQAGERENFAPDGYHPSVEGNRRAAAAFSAALSTHFGIPTAEPDPQEVA